MLEVKIESYLRTEIEKLGGWMEKHASPGHRGPPDDIVMWPLGSQQSFWFNDNRAAASEFIETKTKGGRLSVLQKRDHAKRRAMGFEVHVIWTMEAAEAYLKSRGKK